MKMSKHIAIHVQTISAVSKRLMRFGAFSQEMRDVAPTALMTFFKEMVPRFCDATMNEFLENALWLQIFLDRKMAEGPEICIWKEAQEDLDDLFEQVPEIDPDLLDEVYQSINEQAMTEEMAISKIAFLVNMSSVDGCELLPDPELYAPLKYYCPHKAAMMEEAERRQWWVKCQDDVKREFYFIRVLEKALRLAEEIQYSKLTECWESNDEDWDMLLEYLLKSVANVELREGAFRNVGTYSPPVRARADLQDALSILSMYSSGVRC